MGKRVFALLIGLSMGFLLACDYGAPLPAATVQPTLTLSPSPDPVQTPQITSEPTASPELTYTVEDFLPFEDVHIHYEEAITQTVVDSYVEYYNAENQILQRKTVDDKRALLEVLRLKDGELERIFMINNLAYMHNFMDRTGKESEVLIKEPIKVGNQWKVQGGTREITALEKHMPVPIGSYAALEITTNMDDGGRQVQYYMKNVGLIADYQFNPDGVMLRKMEAQLREKGKPQTQSIRFYYADKQNNCVSYVTRTIELPTNVNMRDKFANELRNVPGDKTLIPLSPNVRILSIRPDLKGGVTVDFSRQIVEEMSLGNESMSLGNKGEGLLLQAIADTFGDYYGVSRVYILIEGEDYISPNIMLLPSDYLTPNVKNAKRL